jgi:hypothetical protein
VAACLAGLWGLGAARRDATLGAERPEVVAADADPEAMVA